MEENILGKMVTNELQVNIDRFKDLVEKNYSKNFSNWKYLLQDLVVLQKYIFVPDYQLFQKSCYIFLLSEVQ